MIINLDENPLDGPNPPPWRIDYVNDKDSQSRILPEAHTHGIDKFNNLELMIRHAAPNIAASVLDRIGLWLLETKSKLSVGDKLLVLGTNYSVVSFEDSERRPIYRLSWENDPD